MHRRRFSRLFLAVLVLPAAFGKARGEDWYRWRGPNQNGVSPETEWTDGWPPEGPPIAWTAEVGTGFSACSLRDGRLFTMGSTDDTDTVFCLAAGTGERLWTHSYPSPLDDRFFEGGPTSTPAIDGDRVYTLSRFGVVHCLQAETGQVHWSTDVHAETGIRIPGWGFAGSPVVAGELLLLTVGEAGTALNKATGEVVWHSADREAGYATPVLYERAGALCALFASGRSFHGVEVLTGREQWRLRWLTTYGCNAADPIVDGDRVLLSSGYERGAALLDLSPGDPLVVWKSKSLRNQLSSSVLRGGHVYGFDGNSDADPRLTCISLATGEARWSHGGLGAGGLIAAGGRLIILSEQGELLIAPASPESFSPTARARVLPGKCWTPPVLTAGRVYCRNAGGRIACVDLRPAGGN